MERLYEISSHPSKMLKETLIDITHGSRIHRIFSPLYGGHTSILMLHRVAPDEKRGLPTDALAVTPEYLERFVREKQAVGWRFVSMDHLVDRFDECVARKRNMVLTLDDGYRDNLEHARPIFDKLGVPYTIYITNSFPNGTVDLWWYSITGLLEAHRRVEIDHNGKQLTLTLERPKEALNAFKFFYETLGRKEQREFMAKLMNLYPLPAENERFRLTWDEIRELAGDDLCTIGCHTFNHLSLGTLGRKDARDEMYRSKAEIEKQIGRPVRHLAYPFGKKADASEREAELAHEIGFKSAVSTRVGNLFAAHRDHLLMLPRIPLYEGGKNGKLSEIFLSGMYTAFTNGFRRVVAD